MTKKRVPFTDNHFKTLNKYLGGEGKFQAGRCEGVIVSKR